MNRDIELLTKMGKCQLKNSNNEWRGQFQMEKNIFVPFYWTLANFPMQEDIP